MKKRYRLLKKKEFEKVFKDRVRIRTESLVFYYLPKKLSIFTSLENIRIGIIIPKKRLKRANKRNYLKRVLWAINSSYNLDILPKTMCIFLFTNFFYLKYPKEKLNFQRLKKEVERIYSILLKRFDSDEFIRNKFRN